MTRAGPRARTPLPPTGTAPDRTRLAWRRTVLAITAVGLLTIRLALVEVAGPMGLAVTAGCLVAWLAVLVVTFRRIHALATFPPAPAGRVVPLSALAAAGFAGLGVLLMVTR